MPRKGENIFKRKDGRWEARYIKSYDASGKAQYGFCYGKSYTEAKSKVALRKAECDPISPTTNVGDAGLFGKYCEDWLADKRESVHEASYAKYRRVMERHIKPFFGNMRVSEITTEAVNVFSRALLNEKGLSAKTVRDILLVLSAALKHASQQCNDGAPQVILCYPKVPRKEMRVLSREEQLELTGFLTTNMDECKLGILLSLMTGLRIGEICALKWCAISLKSGTLRVSATMQRLPEYDREGNKGKTHVYIGEPKSKTSARVIPLSPMAVALCRRFCPLDPETYVLTGAREFIEPRVLQRRFKKYTELCNLENVTFHTLRHTFATRCMEVGFELKSLSEVLGHASTQITLDRYIHSTIDFKRSNMQKLVAVGL